MLVEKGANRIPAESDSIRCARAYTVTHNSVRSDNILLCCSALSAAGHSSWDGRPRELDYIIGKLAAAAFPVSVRLLPRASHCGGLSVPPAPGRSGRTGSTGSCRDARGIVDIVCVGLVSYIRALVTLSGRVALIM